MNQSKGRQDLLTRIEALFKALRENRPKVKQEVAAECAGVDQGTISKRLGQGRVDIRLGIDSFAGLLLAYGIDIVSALEFLIDTSDLPKRVQSFLKATEGRASTAEHICIIALARAQVIDSTFSSDDIYTLWSELQTNPPTDKRSFGTPNRSDQSKARKSERQSSPPNRTPRPTDPRP